MSIISNINELTNQASLTRYLNNVISGNFVVDVANKTITLDAIDNLVIPVADWKKDHLLIQTWIAAVTSTFSLLNVPPIDSDLRFIRSATLFRGNAVIDGYSSDIKINYTNQKITVFARLATVLTWGQFLYLFKFRKDFYDKI